jgi:hypothetical protein
MHSSSAQKGGQARIDSLLTAMHSVHKDSNLVNLLVDLSFTYSSIDPDAGIKYGKQGFRPFHSSRLEKRHC